jgi:uncharacterized protein (TIGR02058 family)
MFLLRPRGHAGRALGAFRRHIQMSITRAPPGFSEVIFIETGTGCDQHGQSATKASVRAIKDAISWNSIPSLEKFVPGGNECVKLRLQLAVPFCTQTNAPPDLDLEEIRKCFAYGTLQEPIDVMPGGARFESMCSVPALGDPSGDSSWVVAVACVTVGY